VAGGGEFGWVGCCWAGVGVVGFDEFDGGSGDGRFGAGNGCGGVLSLGAGTFGRCDAVDAVGVGEFDVVAVSKTLVLSHATS
jgi:hypothetical protein